MPAKTVVDDWHCDSAVLHVAVVCDGECVVVPVVKHGPLALHGLHEESAVDLNANSAHTVILYNPYVE